MIGARKKQFRFGVESDISLLRQVLCENPFANGWDTVSAGLMLPVDARRCRERTMLLIEQHRKENTINLKK